MEPREFPHLRARTFNSTSAFMAVGGDSLQRIVSSQLFRVAVVIHEEILVYQISSVKIGVAVRKL